MLLMYSAEKQKHTIQQTQCGQLDIADPDGGVTCLQHQFKVHRGRARQQADGERCGNPLKRPRKSQKVDQIEFLEVVQNVFMSYDVAFCFPIKDTLKKTISYKLITVFKTEYPKNYTSLI